MAKKTNEAPVTEAPVEETTVDLLITAAEEMNQVMGLDPEIDLELDEAALLERVKTEAVQIIAEDEKEMTPEVWAYLQENGFIDHLKKPEKPAKATKKEKAAKPAKPAKEKKEKAPKDPNAPKKVRAGREGIEKDEFGFYVDQPRHLFGKMLKEAGEAGITMADAKKADWNTTGATFNDPVRIMTEQGKCRKEGHRFYYIPSK